MFEKQKLLHFLYWIIAGIFIFLFLYLLVKLSPVYGLVLSFLCRLLAPFIISGLIAYLLYPVIQWVHHRHIPKSIAILCIYLLFFCGLGYLIYRGYPAVVRQLHTFNTQLPQYAEMYEEFIYRLYEFTSFLPETVHDKMDHIINGLESYMQNLLGKLIGNVTKVFDFIVLLTVIPVLVFYFLKDFTKIKIFIKRQIPKKHHHKFSQLIKALDKSLGGYIRGQFIVCAFVGAASFAVFKFMDVQYALLLAIIMAFVNIIPYFGPIIGAVPAVLIVAPVSIRLVIYMLIAIFVIQLIESNLLSPYIVGKSIHIHPIAIIFALLLGAEAGNVIGMIVAVPVLTILKVIASELHSVR